MVSHEWPEGHDDQRDCGALSEASASKVNEREAEMMAALTRYLLQQGYQPSDLVLLTPYLGQMRLLRKQLKECNVEDIVGHRDVADLVAANLAEEVRFARPHF
jgi:superfamily I DNA and/or RNA helicase